jgi:hypothetical protein
MAWPQPVPEPGNLAAGAVSGSTPALNLSKLRPSMIFRRHWAAFLLSLGALLPREAAGQVPTQPPAEPSPECPNGRISQLFIDNHSIFDPAELADERRFRWAYQLVNALHIRTRPRFIRRELLFGVGSCYDPALLDESERLLRDYRFIASADIYGLQQPDGSWHVVIDTQDEWTTKVNLAARWNGGPEFLGASLTEENFLGRGILVGGFVRNREQERELGGVVQLPRIGGTRLDTEVSAGRTRNGNFIGQSFQYPFVGEVGRVAGREIFLRRATSFPYSVGAGRHPPEGTVTHVLLPLDEERFELTIAGRVGRPGNLTIFGAGFSNETLDCPGYPEGLEVAVDRDFGDPLPADSATIEAVRHQTLHSAGTRVNLLIGQRNVRFQQFRGLDALRGTVDVALGSDLALTIGRTLSPLSEKADHDQPDDLYLRFRMTAGIAPTPFLFFLGGGVEGRQIFAGGSSDDGWNDVLADLTLLMYVQPWERHTLFGRITAAGGWEVTQPFQLTLGGEGAVRGYDQYDFPTGRRIVFSAEDRIFLGWPFPNLFDFGMTLLADMGAGWAGDTPFGMDTDWRATIGGGLRFAFPAGSRAVTRVDVAWPVKGEGLGRPFLRVSMGDPIGLAAGLVDRQVARSRRLAVGTDLFSVRRR